MKVITSSKKINPFGGINIVIDALRKKQVSGLIDEVLGSRPKQAKYSFSDTIMFWIYANFCGAERLEDTKHFKKCLDGTPDVKCPSPDAIGRVFKSLSTKNVEHVGTKKHAFNTNQKLLDLMSSITMKLGLIDTTKKHILDYDNTIIQAHKFDCMNTYEYKLGYQPGISFIGKVPVYVEGREGHSPAQYKMNETLINTIQHLKKNNIGINRFRSDSAAYQKSVIEMMDDSGVDFFIRARDARVLRSEIASIQRWKKYYQNGIERELATMYHIPFNGKKKYRYVAVRTEINNEFYYSSIITNNLDMTDEEVLQFYNQRGKIERNFDTMKNDFNWRRLPFSFMNENTAFMIIGAISYLIYLYMIRTFSKKVGFVKKKYRLKNFIYFFITVGAEWIGRSELKLYTTNNYEVLLE